MYNEGKNLTKVGLRKKWAQGISDIEHGQFFKLFSAKRNQEFGQQPAEKWHQENMEETSECLMLIRMIQQRAKTDSTGKGSTAIGIS